MLDLTEKEEQIILKHREIVKQLQFNDLKKRLCEHEWVFSCFTHKEMAYDCRKCGAIKFE